MVLHCSQEAPGTEEQAWGAPYFPYAQQGAWLHWGAQSLWIVLSYRLSILIFTFVISP